jgi:hypothetical protein
VGAGILIRDQLGLAPQQPVDDLGDGYEIEVTEFDWKERNGIYYDKSVKPCTTPPVTCSSRYSPGWPRYATLDGRATSAPQS